MSRRCRVCLQNEKNFVKTTSWKSRLIWSTQVVGTCSAQVFVGQWRQVIPAWASCDKGRASTGCQGSGRSDAPIFRVIQVGWLRFLQKFGGSTDEGKWLCCRATCIYRSLLLLTCSAHLSISTPLGLSFCLSRDKGHDSSGPVHYRG